MEEEKEFKFESDEKTNDSTESTNAETKDANEAEVKTDEVDVKSDVDSETKVKQNSKTNARFKEQRLANENSNKTAEENAYLKGKIDALKINTFTNSEIKTKRDVEIYEAMKEAESKNLDPVSEGYKIYFNKIDEAEKAAQAEVENANKQENQRKTQLESFEKIIPDKAKREALLADEDFKSMYEDVLANGGDLGKAAKTYLAIQEKALKQAELTAKAKAQSQPPSSVDGEVREKSIDNMSAEEVHNEFMKRFGRY